MDQTLDRQSGAAFLSRSGALAVTVCSTSVHFTGARLFSFPSWSDDYLRHSYSADFPGSFGPVFDVKIVSYIFFFIF
jgi:hypothetical protein